MSVTELTHHPRDPEGQRPPRPRERDQRIRFAGLGISPLAERVYCRALQCGRVSVADLAADLAVGAEAVAAAAEELVDQRLLGRDDATETFVAAPPMSAIDELVGRRLDDLSAAWRAARALALRGARHDVNVEIISGIPAVRALLSRLEPRDVILGRPFGDDHEAVGLADAFAAVAARPGARVLVDPAGSGEAVFSQWVGRAHDAGASVRLRANLGPMAALGARSGCVALPRDSRGECAVALVSPRCAVAPMAALFEAVWQSSSRYGADDPSTNDGLPATTLQILQLLAAGLKDEAIGRRLNMSRRSVQRHVDRAMQTLNAMTRFQAGMEAVRRGLV